MFIEVNVKPRAKEESFLKISETEYTICVKEPAQDGKANARVIKILSHELKIPSKLFLLKTPHSRKKLIEIVDLPRR